MRTIVILFFFGMVSLTFSQAQNVSVCTVGNKISGFSLQTYQGGTFSMEALKGKNILIISSRGKYKDNSWCTICHYQYAEFVELEQTQNLRKKYNMEIAFLFPFNTDTFRSWENSFPAEMDKLNAWKNPENPDSLNAGQKSWMEFAKKAFPKTFNFRKNKIQLTIPLLIDENHEVAKGLDLFRTEWGGTKTDQNIPAVYLIDKDGILRFKYVSQSTLDRPSANYIMKMIDNMLEGKLNEW